MYQIQSAVHTEIEIKKSRFIGMLYPVSSRQEAQGILRHLRTQHPHAVHVCWALICEADSGLDDDGEPSGTAAKPMYHVLVHKDLTNVLAVVVRYWGGIKLGAGGLTRAYGQAISDAFSHAVLSEIEPMVEALYAVDFANESQLRHCCEPFQVHVLSASYENEAILKLKMKKKVQSEFEKLAQHTLRGAFKKIVLCESCVTPSTDE